MIAILVALLLGGLAEPTAAWAHSELVSSDPAANATRTTVVTSVTLTFSAPIEARFSTVLVMSADGLAYANGPVRANGATATQDVYPLRSGAYRMAWRVVSQDGHPISGELRFQVALAPGQEPTATPPGTTAGPGAGGGGAASPATTNPPARRWWWLPPVLIAAGAVLWFARRRLRAGTVTSVDAGPNSPDPTDGESR